ARTEEDLREVLSRRQWPRARRQRQRPRTGHRQPCGQSARRTRRSGIGAGPGERLHDRAPGAGGRGIAGSAAGQSTLQGVRMTRILIVEDDPAMAVALRDGFEFEQYQVEMAADGLEGARLANAGGFDMMILDVMLPKQSGLDVCKELRANGNRTPIIMLTARGQEIDKIVG